MKKYKFHNIPQHFSLHAVAYSRNAGTVHETDPKCESFRCISHNLAFCFCSFRKTCPHTKITLRTTILYRHNCGLALFNHDNCLSVSKFTQLGSSSALSSFPNSQATSRNCRHIRHQTNRYFPQVIPALRLVLNQYGIDILPVRTYTMRAQDSQALARQRLRWSANVWCRRQVQIHHMQFCSVRVEGRLAIHQEEDGHGFVQSSLGISYGRELWLACYRRCPWFCGIIIRSHACGRLRSIPTSLFVHGQWFQNLHSALPANPALPIRSLEYGVEKWCWGPLLQAERLQMVQVESRANENWVRWYNWRSEMGLARKILKWWRLTNKSVVVSPRLTSFLIISDSTHFCDTEFST